MKLLIPGQISSTWVNTYIPYQTLNEVCYPWPSVSVYVTKRAPGMFLFPDLAFELLQKSDFCCASEIFATDDIL